MMQRCRWSGGGAHATEGHATDSRARTRERKASLMRITAPAMNRHGATAAPESHGAADENAIGLDLTASTLIHEGATTAAQPSPASPRPQLAAIEPKPQTLNPPWWNSRTARAQSRWYSSVHQVPRRHAAARCCIIPHTLAQGAAQLPHYPGHAILPTT